MPRGNVEAIFIARKKEPMQAIQEVAAIAGSGLEGDRYCLEEGSFSKPKLEHRQVTLINSRFFKGSSFEFHECRRNIVTSGIELMMLMQMRFRIGEAVFEGHSYCDPCELPGKIAGKGKLFMEEFEDCGGIAASIIESGKICTGDEIVALGFKE